MIPRVTSRWLFGWLLLLGLAHAPAARADFAVVSIRSIQDALSDLKYIFKLAGKENEMAQFEGIVQSVLPTSGLDTQRPFGLMVTKPQSDKPPILVFIPINSEADFKSVLQGFNLEIKDFKNGLHALDTPFGLKVYMKFAHRYLFVSEQEETLKGDLPDPMKSLSEAHRNNLMAVSVRFDRISDAEKHKLLTDMDAGMAREKERRPGESEGEYRGRLAGMKIVRDLVEELMRDGKEFGLSFNLDQEKHRLRGDLYMTAKSGSKLAGRIERFGRARSMFHGLTQSSAMSLVMHLPLDEQIRKDFNDLIDVAFQEAMNEEQSMLKKMVAEKVFKTLEPTLKSDLVDLGLMVFGPDEHGHLTGLAALRIREGKKMEELARDLIRNIPEKEKEHFSQDVAKVEGVAIHCIRPPNGNPQAIDMFGAIDVHFAFRDDVFLVAVGKNGLAHLEKALRSLASSSAAGGQHPMKMELHLSQLIGLEKDPEKRAKAKQLAAEIFKDRQQDDVNVTLQGGDAFRLRLDVSTHIVPFVFRLNQTDQ